MICDGDAFYATAPEKLANRITMLFHGLVDMTSHLPLMMMVAVELPLEEDLQGRARSCGVRSAQAETVASGNRAAQSSTWLTTFEFLSSSRLSTVYKYLSNCLI